MGLVGGVVIVVGDVDGELFCHAGSRKSEFCSPTGHDMDYFSNLLRHALGQRCLEAE